MNTHSNKEKDMNTTKMSAYDWANEIAEAVKNLSGDRATAVRIRLRKVPVEQRTATYRLLAARGLMD
jgi:hypothetical protein